MGAIVRKDSSVLDVPVTGSVPGASATTRVLVGNSTVCISPVQAV